MFRHILRYGLLSLLRTREIVFWTLIFPFALTTFMYFAFSNIFSTTEQFHAIPVAVVRQSENKAFTQILDMLSAEGENQILQVQRKEKAQAEKMLQDGDVKGILYEGETVSLAVAESGMDQTMLKMIMEQFVQYEKTISDVWQFHPEKLMQSVTALASQEQYVEEKKNNRGE